MKQGKDYSMKPFWEEEYLNKEKSTFGKPSKEVEEIVPLLPKNDCCEEGIKSHGRKSKENH